MTSRNKGTFGFGQHFQSSGYEEQSELVRRDNYRISGDYNSYEAGQDQYLQVREAAVSSTMYTKTGRRNLANLGAHRTQEVDYHSAMEGH